MATLDSNKVTGVSNVSDPNDAVNKFYVDNKSASSLYPNPISSDSNKFLGVGLEAWTKRTSGLYNEFVYDAAYAPGIPDSYAVLSRDVLITSTDTIRWRKRTTGFASVNVRHRSITHGSVYVLGGWAYNASSVWHGPLMTSTDGIRWTHRTTPFGADRNFIYKVRYLNDLYIATGGYFTTSDGGGTKVAVSTDAIVWISRTTGWLPFSYIYGAGETPVYYNVSYAKGIYVVSGFPDISVLTSTDTIHWQTRTTGLSRNTSSSNYFYGSVATSSIDNSYVLTKGTEGMIISSTDSIVWTFRTSGTGNTGFHDNGIVYNNQYILAGGDGGSTYGHINTSSDAIHWSVRTVPGSIDYLAAITETEGGSILVCSFYTSNAINLYDFGGRSWEYAKGTQEYTVPGSYTFNVPSKANQLYVEIIGAGGGGSAGEYSGGGPIAGDGGGGGAYISSIIRRSELNSDYTLSVTVGGGGNGGTPSSPLGREGGDSTIIFNNYYWRAEGGSGSGGAGGFDGSGGLVYGHTTTVNSLGLISVPGGNGGNMPSYTTGPGISTFPSLPNQITGGASGGYDGNGGNVTSYYYGNTHISIGGTSGSIDGQSGMSTSLTGSYGSGGAGGYSDTSTSTHGDGGDGTVGGGGGGGGAPSSGYGTYGGRGGDGYVKIVWW